MPHKTVQFCTNKSAVPHIQLSILILTFEYKIVCDLMKGKILIVDDNEDVLFALHLLLEPYVEKVKVTTSPSRIEHFMDSFSPDVILLDMNFSRDASSGQEGLEWLDKILQKDPQAVVVFITAYADTEKAVKAIRAGATDFISKPWEKEKLLATLSSAVQLRRSRCEVLQLKQQIDTLSTPELPPIIIGQSKVMGELTATLRQISDTEANILLLGENGTGKDLVARAIALQSPRAASPFVSIDLGSIPETLFESELFGYEKGAFTDARTAKAGRLETASGGTLFLDEIGNLSLAMQARLLTTLEKRSLSRLGSNRTTPLDIRLICATNADIHRMTQEGSFRQDLLYRINTIEISIPPLRERDQDILLLAEHFLRQYSYKYKKEIKGITREAQRKLLAYPWPGNVRELQHAVERAIILATGTSLQPENFLLKPPKTSTLETETLNLQELEQKAIRKAMKISEGNISRAAEMLGITRFALYRKLEKHPLL